MTTEDKAEALTEAGWAETEAGWAKAGVVYENIDEAYVAEFGLLPED